MINLNDFILYLLSFFFIDIKRDFQIQKKINEDLEKEITEYYDNINFLTESKYF
jgi:hypothetical protein